MPIKLHSKTMLSKAIQRKTRHRHGSVYLAVTGVAMILSLVGFTALHIARLELRSTTDVQDQEYARCLAMSAVEMVLAQIEKYPDWRTDFSHGVKYERIPNNYGAPLRFRLLDNDNGNRDGGDGDLADDDTESVEIQGIGRYGRAVAVYSVVFAPAIHELKSYTTENNKTTDKIYADEWYGQYFRPSFPKVAVSWTVTSVEVRIKQDAAATGTLNVTLHQPNASLLPGTPLATTSTNATDLPNLYDWHEFFFSNATDLDPEVGLCLSLTSVSPETAKIEYESSGVAEAHAHMFSGGSGNWTGLDADESLYYRIYGYYTTASGSRAGFTLSPGSWKTVEAP